jgi:Carboxypeptidase regulatory-like domain
MRHRPLNLISILLLIAFSQSAGAQTPQRDGPSRTASIGGQVTISGQPAANVTVTIVESVSSAGGEFFGASSATAKKEPESFDAVTDAGGRYRLAGLAAGNYKVSASSKAYVLANQNTDIEPAKWITLDGGEAREDVDFSLARGGVITGRVTTSEGRPLIATRVWLYALLQQGDRTEYKSYVGQFHEMFETDDRGVYRLYGLPAGRYILSAGGAESYSSFRNPARNYRPAYFRDSASGKATIIEVKEGSEITDINIKLGDMKKTYEASGRLIEAETETPIPQAPVYAMSFDRSDEEDDWLRDSDRDMRSVSAVTDSQGNFRLTGLTPGRYEAGYSNSWKNNEYYSDSISFEIVDDNVAGLEVKAIRAATISGVAVIEGSVDPNLRKLLFTPDAINVDTIYVEQNSRSVSRRPITEIKPNGAFRASVSRRGKGWKVYFVANQWKVKGLRVSRVELNGAEVTDGIEANPGQQITGVRVVFIPAIGMIRGQVKFIGALPENAELTVAVTSLRGGGSPARDGHSAETAADGKGRFVFEGLSPGEYAVRAYLRFVIDRHTTSSSNIESPTQRVTVTNGQETPVELTIDLNKAGQQKER